ncbi:hypothetical protein [Vibrio sp. YYF0003]|uniref:hypothetical protein n=1 Tax=Vibrio sp. YYF0003 TaxID=3116646 RepID=UPI002ECCE3D8|nr:hypothetical protein [Vibrio sp. YYF0003]
MNKNLLSLVLLTASAGVMAQNGVSLDQQKIDSDMRQLHHIYEKGATFIMIDKDSRYEIVEFFGIWVDRNNYVSRKDSKVLNLEVVNKQFVYSHTGDTLDSLEEGILEHLDVTLPNYFSVDVYRNYHGNSGQFNYLARVIEYK